MDNLLLVMGVAYLDNPLFLFVFFSLFDIILFSVGFFGFKNNDNRKDLSDYFVIKDVPIRYEERKDYNIDSGLTHTLLYPFVIYYVREQEYKWISTVGYGREFKDLKFVDVYYMDSDPIINAVPQIASKNDASHIFMMLVSLLMFFAKIIIYFVFIK